MERARTRSALERLTPTIIGQHLIILDKTDHFVPYTPNRTQLHFRQHRTGRDLVLKARQLGLSTEIQADAFMRAVTTTSRQATLAHDQETTDKLRYMTTRFWKHLPDEVRPARSTDNASTTRYQATGSEVSIATAGALNTGRGGTYSQVHGSEVAFWRDGDSLMKGLLQGVPDSGRIVLESTANGAQGWFYERCMEAFDGASEWCIHFYPWWWALEYTRSLHPDEAIALVAAYTGEELDLVATHTLKPGQIAWRRAKQRELGPSFAQEYAEDARACFLLSGLGFFADALLSSTFSASSDNTPSESRKYVAGLDFGQTQDYTVLSVIDVEQRTQVALLRINRLPWDEMRSRIVTMCRYWNIDTVLAEANSMGSTNIEALRKDLGGRVQAFNTTAATKPPLIQSLRIALAESGLRLLPDLVQRRELAAFQAKQTVTGHWQYSAPDGEHDDTVIAIALAWHAANMSRRRYDSW